MARERVAELGLTEPANWAEPVGLLERLVELVLLRGVLMVGATMTLLDGFFIAADKVTFLDNGAD